MTEEVKTDSLSTLSKKTVSSILAVALSLLLLPVPALAGDSGLKLAAAAASSPTVQAQPENAVPAPDAASPAGATGKANGPDTPSLPDGSSAINALTPSDSSASLPQSLAPAAAETTFTDTITIGGNPCACTFSVTSDTTAQIGNGTSPAVQLSVSGAVSIPDQVGAYTITGIGDAAFENCSNITSTGLATASHITSIGTLAFGYCMSLTDTGLAENQSLVNVNSGRIFEACRSLTDTGLGANAHLQSLSGNDVFGDCRLLKTTGLATNETLTSIGPGTFGACTSLTDTGLGPNTTLTSMGDRVFAGCTGLTTTGLGDNETLTSLGANTFNGCTALSSTSLEMNKTLVALGDGAFCNCTGLTATGLGANQSIASLGGKTFSGCTAIVHAAVGPATMSIGANCFDADSKLVDTCFYGNWAPTGGSWLGSTPAVAVYYLSEHAAWANKAVADVARSQDSLLGLSKLTMAGGSISTLPSSYWASIPGDTVGRYASGEKVSIVETLSSRFLTWSSDDATGSFADPMQPATVYTVGVPSSGTANLMALATSFEGVIDIGEKKYPCTYSVMADGTVEVGDNAGAAVDRAAVGNVMIPASVEYGGKTYAVTHVGDWAFSDCADITSTGLQLADRVTSIGAYSYQGCTSLLYTGLEDTIQLPALAKVSSIGSGAFSGCVSLRDTGLLKGRITSLGDAAFEGCSSLTSTELSGYTGLNALGPDTFKGCTALTSTGLEVNAYITSIGSHAFQGCTALNDTGLAANATVTSVGDGAFANTGLSNAALDSAAVTFGNKCFDGDDLRSVCFYGNVPPQDSTWLGTRKSAGTPVTIYYLAEDAGWTGKTAADLTGSAEDSLKALSSLAITGGSILTQPSSYWATVAYAASVGRYAQGEQVSIAAANGTFLKWVSDDTSGSFKDPAAASTDYSVGAPASGKAKLTALSQSFNGIINVGGKDIPCTYVAAGDGTAQIGNGSDAAVESGAAGKVILPSTVVYGQATYTVNRIADAAFEDCSGITSTGLASNTSVKSIGADAFKECTHIVSTDLSATSNVDAIGGGAFAGCTALQDTGLAASVNVKSLGNGAFAGCTMLTDTGLAANVGLTAAASEAFQGCTALKSTGLAGNEHITSLGSNVFQGCSALTDTGLAFNSTVSSIGDSAFANTALSNIAIDSAAASFGDRCFDGDDVRSICFFGNVAPHDSSWLGTRKSAGTPIALYYLSEHTGWSDETAVALTGGSDDSLRALSYLTMDATGSILTPASSYWAKLTGSAAENRYAQGDKASVEASDASGFLRWDSDDASGSFADATEAVTNYTVAAPESGTAKLTALARRFSATIRIDGKDAPCIYVASNDGTAQIGDGTIAAIGPSSSGDMILPATVDYGGKTYDVKAIASQAFKGCLHITATGLDSNKSITSVGDDAFSGCGALTGTGLNSNSSVMSMGQGAFQNCTSLIDTGLAANRALKAIGKSVFSGCSALASTGLAVNSSVTLVDANAFGDCISLESTGLATNAHITTLGQDTFSGCIALEKTGLAANASITVLGSGAFQGCTALVDTGLESNSTVASLGDAAFAGCTALASTGMESNGVVASLGDGAFQGCVALVHAAVGGAVASLGKGCFDRDAALEDVCFYGPVPPSAPEWLGAPSAAITVYYLAEDGTWADGGHAVVRAGDAVRALSRLTASGNILAAPAGYWAQVPGAALGRYAQGEQVPVSASDPSAFLRWETDDPTGSFADAFSASTAYKVGAPAGGVAALSVVPPAPVAPVAPDSPGASDASNGGSGFGELAPGSVLGSNTVETPKSTSSSADSQSTGGWYSDHSHGGSADADSSTNGTAAGFNLTAPVAVAIAATGALLVAVLLGLVLMRRRK